MVVELKPFVDPYKVKIAKEMIEKYGVDPKEIAALTPYSAQREEIRKELRYCGGRVRGVPVKTITDSQGTQFHETQT